MEIGSWLLKRNEKGKTGVREGVEAQAFGGLIPFLDGIFDDESEDGYFSCLT